MSYNLKQNLERYKNCYCNKDGRDKVVELYEYPDGEKGTVNVYRQEILFIVEGSAHVAMEGMGMGRTLTKGEFVFLPAGMRLVYDVASGSAMMVVRITGEIPECPVLRVNKSAENVMPYKDWGGIHVLKANKRIRNLVSELLMTLEDGLLCRHFLEGEASRLLFLLNAYYSEEERIKFFSHILTPDIKFSEFVRMNHMKYRTIADLSEALCMTTQAFANRFKKTFGMTPHKWMQQEKARWIYLDICRSDMTLKEIALKYDFPLSSNFFRFCKHTFGETPGNIRKSIYRNMGPDEE